MGQKAREGDGCTPEGTFRIGRRLDQSRFHLFLGMNYPRVEDAEAALRAGRIDLGTRDAITAAHAADAEPPMETPLGGYVGLHGGGAEFDWTQGCIAVADADVEELWVALSAATAEIEVVP